MLRHIILWKLKDTVEDKEGTKAKVKALLEALVGVVDGLEELTVHTDGLASSSADMMLESKMRDADTCVLPRPSRTCEGGDVCPLRSRCAPLP